MDRLVSIPERVWSRLDGGKQLTPLSTDVFVSIPEEGLRLSNKDLKTSPPTFRTTLVY